MVIQFWLESVSLNKRKWAMMLVRNVSFKTKIYYTQTSSLLRWFWNN